MLRVSEVKCISEQPSVHLLPVWLLALGRYGLPNFERFRWQSSSNLSLLQLQHYIFALDCFSILTKTNAKSTKLKNIHWNRNRLPEKEQKYRINNQNKIIIEFSKGRVFTKWNQMHVIITKKCKGKPNRKTVFRIAMAYISFCLVSCLPISTT